MLMATWVVRALEAHLGIAPVGAKEPIASSMRVPRVWKSSPRASVLRFLSAHADAEDAPVPRTAVSSVLTCLATSAG